MKKNWLKNSKGFSLVETIIYVAIFSIFIIGIAQFSHTLSSSRLHVQQVFEVNDQGSGAIKIITQTLRNASLVNTPTIGSSGSNLSIVTESPTTSPTVFSVTEGVLYITEGAGSPVALTNNKVVVSDLNFYNFSRVDTPNIIRISFLLTSTSTNANMGNPYAITFSGSGALRK